MNDGRDFETDNNHFNETPKEQNTIDNEEIVVVPLDDDDESYSENEIFIDNEKSGSLSGPLSAGMTADKLEDISSTPSGFKEKFRRFWLNNNKRNIKIFGFCLLAAVVLISVLIGVHLYNLVKNVDPNSGINFSHENDTYVDEDETDFTAMHAVTDAASLDNLLYQWANNGGEKISSKNVINVMLFGVDSKDGSMENARSDTMLLVSLNKKTKKITLVSFMRDSYTYMNINGSDRYFKINAAYNWGGPATVVETVENNYKIEIDHFVCVDFSTFPKIIEGLGGVTVEVQPREANFIRRTTHLKNFQVINKPTMLKLDGTTALIFSRIRHLDSDNERTRRQREVIMSMIQSARSASAGMIDNTLTKFIMPNIKTNYNRSEIAKLAAEAILQKWADFDIQQILTPSEKYSKSAYIHSNFEWVIDYPQEARIVQLALYGQTNIVLDPGQKSALDMLIPKSSSGSSSTGNSGSTTKSGDNSSTRSTTNPGTTVTEHTTESVSATETGNTTSGPIETTAPIETSTGP